VKAGSLAACLLAALVTRAAAQTRTDELIGQAETLYNQLQVERALPILRQVVSPAWPFEVTREQRVHAYVLMGAGLALTEARDSAVLYFRAAIERDPFVDLDPQRFTRVQIAAFTDARQLTFAVGARPVAPARIDPRTERFTFVVLTTHEGGLRVELQAGGTVDPLVLFDGASTGLREVAWNGLLADGRLAPPGRYELTVAGQSRLGPGVDTERVYFELRHDVAPLEDTLPALRPDELLPEQRPRTAARGDLLRGLAVAAAALLIPQTVGNHRLDGSSAILPGGVAAIATVTGVAVYTQHERHRTIAENVAANAQRRAERAAANAGVRQRNDARLAQAALVITPAAGLGP